MKSDAIFRKMDELLRKNDLALYARLYVTFKGASGRKGVPLLEKGKFAKEIEKMKKDFALSELEGKNEILAQSAKMQSYETMKFLFQATEEVFLKKIPAYEQCIFAIVMMLRKYNLQNSLITDLLERKIPDDLKSMIVVIGTTTNLTEKAALVPHFFKIFQRRYKR